MHRVQLVLVGVVAQESVQGANHRSDHLIAAVAVERGRQRVDDPVMRFAGGLVYEASCLVIGDVVGNDRAAVILSALEDDRVGRARVTACVLELKGDLVAPHLIEQQPHSPAGMASSARRRAAASSSSRMRASTSSG